MGIDIRINIDLTPWQKKLVRGAVVTGAVIAALGIGVALAGPIDTTWVAQGAPLTAANLKASLDGLQAQVTALQQFQAQATADGGYSLGAVYCGETAATEGAFSGPGTLTGYASARGQCQAVTGCSATTAHICTPEEVIRTKALGVPLPSTEAWYATGTWSSLGGNNVGDCQQWTSNSSSDDGLTSYNSGGTPEWAWENCASSHPILCCN